MTQRMRMAAYYACTLWWKRPRISSDEIAVYAGTNASQVRRDLARLGKFGRRGVGYETQLLSAELEAVVLADEDIYGTVAWVLNQLNVLKEILEALDPDGEYSKNREME